MEVKGGVFEVDEVYYGNKQGSWRVLEHESEVTKVMRGTKRQVEVIAEGYKVKSEVFVGMTQGVKVTNGEVGGVTEGVDIRREHSGDSRGKKR